MYVWDTDHLSLNQRGHPKIRERLAIIPADEIAITIITAEEQLRGRLAHMLGSYSLWSSVGVESD
ncbi:MAG: hypothetical protein AABN34_29680 [Acidobacteriota bacterium]